ncbi:hypothetical protein DWY99_04220 [[Clostridium] leptum]|uniref:Uncharacterized protein n=1 Tax=[Clostridium] leptum TaxID=1535 RepID=A0A412AZE8_9FIRM|nr:hypothetical protein DWY99_04220 [[Clostridium] leptum]
MENYYKKRHGIARLCETEAKKKQKNQISASKRFGQASAVNRRPLGKIKGKASFSTEKAVWRALSGNTDKFSPIHEKAAVRRAFRE